MVIDCSWPQADADALVRQTLELVVQVNGRTRGKICVAADADEDSIRASALAEPNAQRFIQGKPVRKLIVVPGRLVNLVVG
jgi:leucyl-tRNA synthetase